MKSRIISVFLALLIMLSSMPITSAFNANNTKVIVFSKDINLDEVADASVFVINYSDLDYIVSKAKEIVDSGTMICVISPESSSENIADLLSIPKTSTTSYQNLLLTAYSIYKHNDQYIFANHYTAFATEGNQNEENSTSNPITDEIDAPLDDRYSQPNSNFSNVMLMTDFLKNNSCQIFIFNPLNILAVAMSARANLENNSAKNTASMKNQSEKDVQPKSNSLPSINATASWNDILSVYGLNNNTYYGYINCTVFGCEKGTGVVNGSNQKIYDVISAVKAYPQSGYKVKRYETQLHCNITGFSNLQTTTITSGINYTQSLSLSGTFGTIGGYGGVTYTTNWSYNPESQVITESSPAPRIVKWRAEPVNPAAGKAYDIIPGMRIACPTNYMRGAFSKVFCDAMILGISVNANEIEVGGWF